MVENKKGKTRILKKKLLLETSIILGVVASIYIPKSINKISNKLYKYKNSKEKNNVDDMGPEIVKKNAEVS